MGFSNIDFYELWLKYQLKIKKIFFIVLGLGGLLILILVITNNPYKNIENTLLSNAKKYITTNDINISNDTYLDMTTLEENGYYLDYDSLDCDNASGILVKKINDRLEYTPFLMCKEYQSETIKKNIEQKSNYIDLNGSNPLILEDEQRYNDPGYTNKSNYTIVVNNQVTDSPNLYFVDYIIKDNNEIKDTVQRIVIVKASSDNNLEGTAYRKGLKLKLNGDYEIFLEQGQPYKELGATAIDYKDGDITSDITISGIVDSNKIDIYTITYTITNKAGTRLEVKRIVNVVKPAVNLNIVSHLSTSNYTNSDVTISLNINSQYYYRTKLPNNTITYSSNINYKVSTNGTYTFYVFDDYGDYHEEKVTVNNINKNPPIGSCTLTNSGGKSTIKVNSNSGINIIGYSYSDGNNYTNYLTSNQYVFNTTINTAYVKIKDAAGNIKSINCSSSTQPVITSGTVEYHFINSGRVDALLIRNGDHAAFVDGGWPEDGIKAVNYLKALGIKKLDFIIGSHSHLNHVGAVGDIINAFDVGAVYFTEDPLNCKNCNEKGYGEMAYKRANAAMKNKGLTAIVERKGDIIYLGSIKIECLAPINYSGSSANMNSLNQIVTFGNTTLMLTGDYMNSESLLKAYSADKLNVDILKYPHHGNYKLNQDLFNALSPKYVIVQNDKDELGTRAPASKKMMEQGSAKIYQNYLNGNIVVISDGKNIEVRTNVDPTTFKSR